MSTAQWYHWLGIIYLCCVLGYLMPCYPWLGWRLLGDVRVVEGRLLVSMLASTLVFMGYGHSDLALRHYGVCPLRLGVSISFPRLMGAKDGGAAGLGLTASLAGTHRVLIVYSRSKEV